jgi:hypothetical protein
VAQPAAWAEAKPVEALKAATQPAPAKAPAPAPAKDPWLEELSNIVGEDEKPAAKPVEPVAGAAHPGHARRPAPA